MLEWLDGGVSFLPLLPLLLCDVVWDSGSGFHPSFCLSVLLVLVFVSHDTGTLYGSSLLLR